MLSRNWVKYIQSLHHKKNGKEAKDFIVEGVKMVNELLQSNYTIKNIFAVSDWIEYNSSVKNIIEISEDDLKKISALKMPNKVLAIAEKKMINVIPDLKNQITIVLDGIQDPGNLGTIIRTADWFGIKNIITSNDTVDVYNTKVLQSTMGSFLRVNIFYIDLNEFFQQNSIPVFGAVLDGSNINSIQKINEALLLIGNESKGIRENIQPFIQHKITIPKIGETESLNAAVATAIILWEMAGKNIY